MYIDLDQINNKLIITFDYEARVVDAVKSLPGRKFDSQFKRWTVPASHAARVLERLTPLGFSYHSSVLSLVKTQNLALWEKEIIRSTPGLCQSNLPLYPFQKIGAVFMESSDGCLLGDVPGLGKSLQTIAALENEKKSLIICPASLKYSWKQEIEKWDKKSIVYVVSGDRKEREVIYKKALIEKEKFFLIINYELLLRDVDMLKLF